MLREVSCRVVYPIVLYVKHHRPDQLPRLLEDFDEEHLANEWEWISYQSANLLYQRAEKIFRRDDIMLEIGREVSTFKGMGITHKLFRLARSVNSTIRLITKNNYLLRNVTDLKILEEGNRRFLLEDRCLPGYVRTRGACNYTRGMFYAFLKIKKWVHAPSIDETRCAVPIWEKGVIDQSCFYLRQRNIIRRNLLTGAEGNMGSLAADNTFAYGGTVYGAGACCYEVTWDEHQSPWRWLLDYLFIGSRLFGKLRRELLDKYNIIEKQNSQLRQTNQVLAGLLKERTDVNLGLEAKVAERTAELRNTIEKLKELDHMKSNFLSVTSHELRTPLTVIKAALSLLLTEGNEMEGIRFYKYLSMAYENCECLIRLIDNLLDFSRLESGRFMLEVKSVDMPQLIQESLDEYKAAALKQGVELSSSIQDQVPLLLGNPGRILQILNHLLSNAVKFTSAGGSVKVWLRQVGDFIELEVEDTGIGMTEMQQKQLFSKFFQGDDSLTRNTGGVGLGLALVKKLVALHEGLVWAESQPDRGSHFFVRLPISGPQHASVTKLLSSPLEEI